MYFRRHDQDYAWLCIYFLLCHLVRLDVRPRCGGSHKLWLRRHDTHVHVVLTDFLRTIQ